MVVRLRFGRGFWAVIGFAAAVAVWPARSRADEPMVFELVLHVATRDGVPVVAKDWHAVLAEVSEPFEPADVKFTLGEVRTLPEGHASLANIAGRRALRRFLVPNAINVFVVEEILDPVPSEATRRAAARVGREPTGRLSGAHIPAPGRRPGTYLVVNHHGGPVTMAHELGHFFGLPHHADESNIMSYGRVRVGFDAAQLRVIRLFAERQRRFRRIALAAPLRHRSSARL
jgi:hypothetical protein